MDGGRGDPRGPEFLQRMEAGTAKRLAIAPEQMSIPFAKMVFVKRTE
jgi:salicylate 1-O-methyltransferase